MYIDAHRPIGQDTQACLPVSPAHTRTTTEAHSRLQAVRYLINVKCLARGLYMCDQSPRLSTGDLSPGGRRVDVGSSCAPERASIVFSYCYGQNKHPNRQSPALTLRRSDRAARSGRWLSAQALVQSWGEAWSVWKALMIFIYFLQHICIFLHLQLMHEYVQMHEIYTIHTNAYKYRSVLTNTY